MVQEDGESPSLRKVDVPNVVELPDVGTRIVPQNWGKVREWRTIACASMAMNYFGLNFSQEDVLILLIKLHAYSE